MNRMLKLASSISLSNNIFKSINLSKSKSILRPEFELLSSQRSYAKKPPALTDAQLQFQKHTAELGFREKTSIRGTKFEFYSVETSLKYLQSEAFKVAYGDKYVWECYIRNHKGRLPKSWTRKECIISEKYITGNPCPICRDPYLVVNYKNVKLLNHFVSPYTGILFPTSKTNVCRRQQENLDIAFEIACDQGLIEYNIPYRTYDYSEYYKKEDLLQCADVEGIKLGADFKKLDNEKSSTLLGVVLGAKRKNINDIYNYLHENDIVLN